MKNIWIISLSAIAFSLASCNQSDELDQLQQIQDGTGAQTDKDLVSVSFTALSPMWTTDTRTSLEENNQVYWNYGDEIVVYYGDGLNTRTWFRAEMDEEKASTAVFRGYTPTYANEFLACYPPENFLYLTDNYQIDFNIPTRQEAVAGTFANRTNPTWAYTNQMGGKLQFQNLASLVKFTLSDGCEDIKSVTLTAKKANAVLTGRYSLNIQDIDHPVLKQSTDYNATSSKSAVLTGEFKAGEPYYFVVAAVANDLQDGFDFVFEKTDGTKYVKKAKAGVINKLESGRIANLGTISLANATFTDDIIDMSFIEAVEQSFGNPGWSKNEDGTIPLTPENLEAMKQITYLNLKNAGLTSLDGIKYFTGLTYLNCSDNSLSDVDLSQLTKLQTIIAQNSGITSLNVDNLSVLKVLRCNNNKLEELNIGHLSQLEELDCSDNRLTQLAADNLTRLTSLKYSYNYGINTLNIGNLVNLKTLECNGNNISTLDVTALTNLETLDCSSNDLSELNLEGLSSLKYLRFGGNSRISAIDLSGMKLLEELQCSGTELEELNISNCPALKYLYCYDMQSFKGQIDLSKNTQLVGLDISNSNLTSLDLSHNENLEYVYCPNNKLQVLDLRNNLRLNHFNCPDQILDNGAKMKLYIRGSQKWIWDNVSSYHSATVDVEIDYSVYDGNGHGSFDETDYSDILK